MSAALSLSVCHSEVNRCRGKVRLVGGKEKGLSLAVRGGEEGMEGGRRGWGEGVRGRLQLLTAPHPATPKLPSGIPGFAHFKTRTATAHKDPSLLAQ